MSTDPKVHEVHERLETLGARVLSDGELLSIILGPRARQLRVEGGHRPARDDPATSAGLGIARPAHHRSGHRPRAAAVAAAFELGRRAGWAPPRRGERVLDPARVYELLRHLAHAEREEFHVVLIDVRGRLLKTTRIAEGSLTQCPVAPRDVFREAVRIGAHGIIFVHNHPSGSADPSPDDFLLTERLKAAADLGGRHSA